MTSENFLNTDLKMKIPITKKKPYLVLLEVTDAGRLNDFTKERQESGHSL